MSSIVQQREEGLLEEIGLRDLHICSPVTDQQEEGILDEGRQAGEVDGLELVDVAPDHVDPAHPLSMSGPSSSSCMKSLITP